MALQITAYRASTGELFETMKEARQAEVKAAADLLGGITSEGLMSLVSGALDTPALRDAIRTIAAALPETVPVVNQVPPVGKAC